MNLKFVLEERVYCLLTKNIVVLNLIGSPVLYSHRTQEYSSTEVATILWGQDNHQSLLGIRRPLFSYPMSSFADLRSASENAHVSLSGSGGGIGSVANYHHPFTPPGPDPSTFLLPSSILLKTFTAGQQEQLLNGWLSRVHLPSADNLRWLVLASAPAVEVYHH